MTGREMGDDMKQRAAARPHVKLLGHQGDLLNCFSAWRMERRKATATKNPSEREYKIQTELHNSKPILEGYIL